MKKTIRDFDLNNKKVIIRCDLNVPINDGIISDDTRIKATIPTIQYLVKNGAKVVLATHLGKAKGEGFQEEFSLKIVLERLKELL